MRRSGIIAADFAGAGFNARPGSALLKVAATMGRHALPIAVAAGGMLAGAIYTWFAGEDANWDWQNYHEYNVWAVLHGRYGIDALPAGFQTWFNPVVYFPVYALRHLLPAPFGMLMIGAIDGLVLFAVYVLSRVLLREYSGA